MRELEDIISLLWGKKKKCVYTNGNVTTYKKMICIQCLFSLSLWFGYTVYKLVYLWMFLLTSHLLNALCIVTCFHIQIDSEGTILFIKEYLFQLLSQMRPNNIVERAAIWELKRFYVLTPFWHFTSYEQTKLAFQI